MADVSKLARTRLAKATVAGPHPDADLLTAFAERLATPAEREQVLAHLATCAECREVVALAAPTEPVEEAVAVAPAKPKRLPWPVLRWGAVAAAVAVVAIAVIVQAPRYQQAPQSASIPVAAGKAKVDKEAGFASAETKAHGAAAPTAPAVPAAVPAKEAAAKKDESEAFAFGSGRADKPVASPTADMDRLAVSPPPSPVMAPTQRAETKLQKTAPSASGGMVGATASSEHAKTAAPAQAEMASTTAAQPPTAANENMKMARSAPAASKPAPAREERGNYAADAYLYDSAATGSGAAVNGQREASRDFRVRGIAYKWTVTSDGRVQRSTDGRTWFYVPVDPKARLRALASDGDEVWVGGDRAALYHSTDAGESWNKVPMDRVSGDIIRIIINGEMLQLTTSAGQTISVSHNSLQEAAPKANSPR